MNIFFGKIKATADDKQIKGAFYQTLSPMKLGEIKAGDYAFIISGGSIHLWRAKERVDLDGSSRMNFDIIESNLPLNSKKIVAFKYFKLDSSLIVLTIRQSPKAFYPIEIADTTLTEDVLINPKTYTEVSNFRAIHVLKSVNEVKSDSKDVQIYFNNQGKLEIFKAPFFHETLFPTFVDNLSMEGYGRKQKDKALAKIKAGRDISVSYNYDELPILRMYDALFNNYGSSDDVITGTDNDQDEGESDGASWELKSFNQIYYGPPGTGKTYLVRKNFCEDIIDENNDVVDKIKLDIDKNFWHLAPGRNGYLWEQLRKGNVLGYEWVDKTYGDISQLTYQHVNDNALGSYKLITYIREVKKGDYICIISGRAFYGIAEVLEKYDHTSAMKNDFAFQTIPVKWLKQFDQPLLLNTSQRKTFVRLNNGTRWGTLLTLLRENGFYFDTRELAESILLKPKNFSFITFHQSFSYEDFIEGIKPVLTDEEDSDVTSEVGYQIVPGIFYQACERAAQLAGYNTLQDCLADNKFSRQKTFSRSNLLEYYLIIDELNRGNVASIFGELITLIEDDKRIGSPNEIIATLPYSKTLFGVPLNLRIIGTMNTADRSIEALDTALRRRFTFEEVLPDSSILPHTVDGLDVNLQALLSTINKRLEKLLGRDHTIGHSFFLKITSTSKLKTIFCNKIIPLLQEYFYADYARIGLVIGTAFIDIKKEKTLFMKVDGFDSRDLEDNFSYNLKDMDNMSDEDFLTAVRSIYG